MSTILVALSLGAVSMIIVFISGMMSGVVRLGTLTLRSLIAFCVTSFLAYLVLMLFEMYDKSRRKKAEQIAKELSQSEEAENPVESENTQGNFQPINPSDYPQA